jgi:hypothetical protein
VTLYTALWSSGGREIVKFHSLKLKYLYVMMRTAIESQHHQAKGSESDENCKTVKRRIENKELRVRLLCTWQKILPTPRIVTEPRMLLLQFLQICFRIRPPHGVDR